MQQVNIQRRKWLSLGGIVLGASVLPNQVMAALSTPAPLKLRFNNINTGDKYVASFAEGRGLTANDLGRLNYLMRDRRSGQVTRMDVNLFYKLNQIQRRLGLRNAEVDRKSVV